MSDLTATEQTHVRTALKFLRLRCGTWAVAAKALRFGESTLSNIAAGRKVAAPLVAFRVARLAMVSVDDVLTGKYPPEGTCPHCGHRPEGSPVAPLRDQVPACDADPSLPGHPGTLGRASRRP